MSCLDWISDLGERIYHAVAHVGKGARLNVPAAADIRHATSAPSDAPRSAGARHYGPARAPGPLTHMPELLRRRMHHLYDVLHPPSVLISTCALALSAPGHRHLVASLGLVHLLLPALTPLLPHPVLGPLLLSMARAVLDGPAVALACVPSSICNIPQTAFGLSLGALPNAHISQPRTTTRGLPPVVNGLHPVKKRVAIGEGVMRAPQA